MPMLNLHSKTKAPGMILYYMAFIKTLGHSQQTALTAGIVLGAICTLAIPACYWFLLTLLEDKGIAFLGACFLSLCPGFVLFFPASDPAYAILSCLIAITWIKALRQNRMMWAVATGAITATILVISFNLLVFGLFLVAFALLASGRPVKVIAKHAAIALAVCVALTVALWLVTGYNPIATFFSAWRNQQQLLADSPNVIGLQRPYPATIWNDLLDFALGSGWISVVLAGFTIALCLRNGIRQPQSRYVLLAIGQFLVVAISALLASETARVWNFMYPLLMIPVGIELSRHRIAGRIVILSCLALILAAVCRNMSIFM